MGYPRNPAKPPLLDRFEEVAMARRRKAEAEWPGWTCSRCMNQFFGGPRCYTHNPTPEEREAHPERYTRERYAPSAKAAAAAHRAALDL